ncbi:MAG TPA: ATP-binding protein [Candidatus Limnocylindrales bacterium]|nr:ATP-binding protein [Candidatus Limnocylindrales bacterium]
MNVRRWMADLPIGSKLTVLAAAASAIALLVSSAAFVAYDRATFDEFTIRRLSGEAAIVAANSATAIVFRDPEAAQVTLAALAAERDVTAAALYTMDGELFAAYATRAGAELPIPPSAVFSGHAFVDRHLLVHRRVMFEGSPVGTVVIRDDLSARWERLRYYLTTVAEVSLAALLVALLAGRLAGRAISAPILALAETARAVSERSDFSARVVPRGRDEVGVLMITFNEMLDGLERRDADLRRIQAELERRVEERTVLLREAEDANRLKDQFLATLSHELRTPLNAIVGWTTLLIQGNLAPDAAERAVAVIDRNARAQTKLIEDVLDVSRIVSGKLRLNARALDLPGVVKAAAESVGHAAAAKRIRLKLVLEAGTGLVSGDPDRLQQVVWNLLSNAIKFTPAGGTVTAHVAQNESNVSLVVRDDGAGIAPGFLPHVFDRFRQADATTTRAHGGLGLGLSIVRHLVELHGGTVRAESEGPGRGSTFTVALPMIADEGPAVATATLRPARPDFRPDLHGLYVLVVDDEVDGRSFVETALAGHGAEVEGVGSAADAMAAVVRRVPDAIVCDIEMPGRDGLDLIREIRALPAARGRIPATALTAHVRPEDRVRSLVAGFQVHLGKPVDPFELAVVVAGLARPDALARRTGGP